MKPRMVNVDRVTPMLLPPDLREWVAEDDMVHFVIEAVEGMALSTLKLNRRGSGSAQYPPRMMLALLIYCYANGIFSSRRIERATWRDVAVRYLTGDTHPDHDTICKFRRENFAAVAEAFLQVLRLARQMGLLKVGTVSVDGTHIAASASKDRNLRYDRAGELEAQLSHDIAELMQQAERTDQQETDDGQSLPERISRREALQQKMREARRQIEQQTRDRAQAEREAYQRKLARRQAAGLESRETSQEKPQESASTAPPAAGPQPGGHDDDHEPPSPSGGVAVTAPTTPAHPAPTRRLRKPPAGEPVPAGDQQINLTDPDSRLMRKTRRSAYSQSYNAQAAVDADGSMLILAGHVTSCASDVNELVPAVQAIDPSLGQVRCVLADSGYANAEAIDQLQGDGLELYVAVGRQDQARRYDYRPPAAVAKPPRPVSDPTLVAMQQKLQTDAGRKRYRLRQQTSEPVFGIIKSGMGFTRFLLRGLEKVRGEWTLISLAYNLKRLCRLRLAA